MSQDTNRCIESDELLEFFHGLTDPARAEFISEHLGHCDACATRCGQLDLRQLQLVHGLRPS